MKSNPVQLDAFPFVRSAYNYDRDKASRESGLHCKDESLTIQSQKEDADINVLVKRFGITGHMPQGIRIPEYGDFDTVSDYRSALHAVMEARESFMQLPAEVRMRFNDDPQLFLEYADGKSNEEVMKFLGVGIDSGKKADIVSPKPEDSPKA